MPTLYRAQLTEASAAMLEIWKRMLEGLKPRAREILSSIQYYPERDVPVPSRSEGLTIDELAALEPIATALMRAAVAAERMSPGKLVATLQTIATNPSIVNSCELPADVLWEIAASYRRANEGPGTFAMDVWATENICAPYPLDTPTCSNITRAAEYARERIQNDRKRGRPFNESNLVLAQTLAPIWNSTGVPIKRHRKDSVSHGKHISVESGPLHDFLELVLPPIQQYLRERRLSPVTVESIVRVMARRQRAA